jgi:hypothetical protein
LVGDDKNISTFGICHSPQHPDTPIITLKPEALDPSTGKPWTNKHGDAVPLPEVEIGNACAPLIIGEWYNHSKLTIDNGKAISLHSFLICRYGGLIEPQLSGQTLIEPYTPTLRQYTGTGAGMKTEGVPLEPIPETQSDPNPETGIASTPVQLAAAAQNPTPPTPSTTQKSVWVFINSEKYEGMLESGKITIAPGHLTPYLGLAKAEYLPVLQLKIVKGDSILAEELALMLKAERSYYIEDALSKSFYLIIPADTANIWYNDILLQGYYKDGESLYVLRSQLNNAIVFQISFMMKRQLQCLLLKECDLKKYQTMFLKKSRCKLVCA